MDGCFQCNCLVLSSLVSSSCVLFCFALSSCCVLSLPFPTSCPHLLSVFPAGTDYAPPPMCWETPLVRVLWNTFPAMSCRTRTQRWATQWWRRQARSRTSSFVGRMSMRMKGPLTVRPRCRDKTDVQVSKFLVKPLQYIEPNSKSLLSFISQE